VSAATAGTAWSRAAERGSRWGLRAILACYRLFGRPLSLVLVHAVVAYFFLTGREQRRASRAYLERVAAAPGGARALGRRPGSWASFLQFRAFALGIFDRLVLWLGEKDALVFEVEGREHYDRLLGPTRGAIVVGAHLGSFDALRALAKRDGRRGSTPRGWPRRCRRWRSRAPGRSRSAARARR
jgi:predicted LPLAT superfamily acyltransferase